MKQGEKKANVFSHRTTCSVY